MSDTTTDIEELYRRDPLKLSDQDLDLIIARLRKQRENFNLGVKSAGKQPKAPAKKIEKINLDDIVLDL